MKEESSWASWFSRKSIHTSHQVATRDLRGIREVITELSFYFSAVYMLTPNGRFATGTKLCLSMSDFHPETWNPLWSVSAVLTGLLSFMLGSEETVGSVQTSDAEKRRLARLSHVRNKKDRVFRELFRELLSESVIPDEGVTVLPRKVPSASQPLAPRGSGGFALFLGLVITCVLGVVIVKVIS